MLKQFINKNTWCDIYVTPNWQLCDTFVTPLWHLCDTFVTLLTLMWHLPLPAVLVAVAEWRSSKDFVLSYPLTSRLILFARCHYRRRCRLCRRSCWKVMSVSTMTMSTMKRTLKDVMRKMMSWLVRLWTKYCFGVCSEMKYFVTIRRAFLNRRVGTNF